MTDEITIEVEGADLVARALHVAPLVAIPLVKQGVDQVLLAIQGQLQPYPPQPDRMRSGSLNRYVRGLGMMPAASFDEGGAFKGPATGPRGGEPAYTSEDLGQKWTSKSQVTPAGFLGVVGNTASYADVVQGVDQAVAHAQTGWVTVVQAAARATKQIERIFTGVMIKLAAVMRRIAS